MWISNNHRIDGQASLSLIPQWRDCISEQSKFHFFHSAHINKKKRNRNKKNQKQTEPSPFAECKEAERKKLIEMRRTLDNIWWIIKSFLFLRAIQRTTCMSFRVAEKSALTEKIQLARTHKWINSIKCNYIQTDWHKRSLLSSHEKSLTFSL